MAGIGQEAGPRALAERLTALDATFLELEEADQGAHMHIGGVMIFDPREDGGAPPLEGSAAIFVPVSAACRAIASGSPSPIPGDSNGRSGAREPASTSPPMSRVCACPNPGRGGAGRVGERVLLQRLDRTRPLWEVCLVEA